MAAAVTPFGLPRVLASAFSRNKRQERYAVNDEATAKPKASVQPPQRSGSKRRKPLKWKKITPRQILRLAHRFLIMCTAVVYIGMSLQASIDAASLLSESTGAYETEGAYTSEALARHIGTTTLRESPFVMLGLQNDTSPRNRTLYYDMESMSFDACEDVMSPSVRDVYSNEFQQTMYSAIASGTAYNLTFLAESESELIAPVVDCTNFLLTSGDETMANLNFLVRSKRDSDDVFMLTFTFVNQAYKIYSQKEFGPAAVGTLTLINDLRAARVDVYYLVSIGYPFEPLAFRVYELVGWSDRGSWLLQNIATSEPGDIVKVVRTGTRSGFFMTTDSDQTNIFTKHWEVSTTDPSAAISGPVWLTKTAISDSWAWSHFLHLIFVFNHLSGLAVLMMVSYQNFRAGKLWIGDAFVAISGRLTLRCSHILVSWFINGFWTFFEFCLYDAGQIAHTVKMNVRIYESIMLADLVTIYLSLCGVLGGLFHERIDPLFALICFYVGYDSRHAILHWFPKATAHVDEFINEFYQKGSPARIDGQDKISPMRLWNTHELKSVPASVVAAILSPIFGTLVVALLYIAVRKVHRHYYPDPMRVEKASSLMTTAKSGSQEAPKSKEQQSVLTLFEIATGAKLANKYGLLAEYDNCLFIKGMKFATPDGVYSSGFVIVDKRHLIQATDFWAILLMKLLRVRYTNIYMYEVNGSTVEQVARLVYPSTFTMSELFYLNTNILS